jgi:hypothetical protein
MHVPSQLTIDGRQAPRQPAQPAYAPACAPERLFTAPQTIRGQMMLTPSEQHAADRCQTLQRSEDLGAVRP